MEIPLNFNEHYRNYQHQEKQFHKEMQRIGSSRFHFIAQDGSAKTSFFSYLFKPKELTSKYVIAARVVETLKEGKSRGWILTDKEISKIAKKFGLSPEALHNADYEAVITEFQNKNEKKIIGSRS